MNIKSLNKVSFLPLKYIIFLPIILFFFILLSSCSTNQATDKNKIKTGNYNNVFESLDTTTINRMCRDIVIRAATYQMQYRFADAILEYEDALQYDSNASIYYSMSKCYRDLNKFDKAELYAVKACNMNQNNIDYLELLAEIYTAKRDLKQAIKVYKKVVDLQPDMENKLNYAKLYEYYDVKQAILEYEKLYKEQKDPYIVSRLLDLYDEVGYSAKKAELISQLESNNQLNIDMSKQLLSQYITQNKFPEAFNLIEKLEKKISINECIDIYKLYLSQFTIPKYFKKNLDLVPKILKKFDSRFKFDVYLQFCGAYLSYSVSDSIKGERFMENYLELTDTASASVVTAASVYSEYGKYSKAESLLKKYENKNEKNINYLLFLADICSKLNKYSESNNYSDKVLALDKENMSAYQIYYLNVDKQGFKDSSRAIAKKIYEMNPKDPVAGNNYAYSLAEQGKDLRTADDLVSKALKVDPDNANYLDTKGWILFKQGELEAALEYVKKSISADSSNAESYIHLGDIYKEKGDLENAKKSWMKGLEIDKNNDILIRRIKEIEK